MDKHFDISSDLPQLAYVLLPFLLVRRGLCSSGFLDPSSQLLLSLPLLWVVYGPGLGFIELRIFFFSDLLSVAIGVAGVLGFGVDCFSWLRWVSCDVQCVDGAVMQLAVQVPCLEVGWCCDGCRGGGRSGQYGVWGFLRYRGFAGE
ncbi:hypothetical protein ACOSP7_020885 [Xanthoceras sorbifolium]